MCFSIWPIKVILLMAHALKTILQYLATTHITLNNTVIVLLGSMLEVVSSVLLGCFFPTMEAWITSQPPTIVGYLEIVLDDSGKYYHYESSIWALGNQLLNHRHPATSTTTANQAIGSQRSQRRALELLSRLSYLSHNTTTQHTHIRKLTWLLSHLKLLLKSKVWNQKEA